MGFTHRGDTIPTCARGVVSSYSRSQSSLGRPCEAQIQQGDRVPATLKEGLNRNTFEGRVVAIREYLAAGDPRAFYGLVAALREENLAIRKKRADILKYGKDHEEIWRAVDSAVEETARKGMSTAPSAAVTRAASQSKDLQLKIRALNRELAAEEALRDAIVDGVGSYLNSADPSVCRSKIEEVVAEEQRARSTEDRRLCVRILAAGRTADGRQALERVLAKDADPEIRVAAALALGESADPAALQVLTAALADAAFPVRTAAADTLPLIPSLRGLQTIAQALESATSGAADALTAALEDLTGQSLPNGRAWVDWERRERPMLENLLEALESPEESARLTAIKTVGAKGILAGVRCLLRAEGLDPLRDSGTGALLGGRKMPDRRSSPAEVDARRAAIGQALASCARPVRDRAVVELFMRPLRQLASLNQNKRVEAYVRAARSVSHPDLFAALAAMAQTRVRPPKSEGPVVVMILPYDRSGPWWDVGESCRAAAIEALGWQTDARAVPTLRQVLAIEGLPQQNRDRVAEAIERIGQAPASTTPQDQSKDLPRDSVESTTSCRGIPTRAKRIAYLLDVSAAMNDKAPGSVKSLLDVARNEIASSIAALPPEAVFNVVTFRSGLMTRNPKPVRASTDAKNEALHWLEMERAIGKPNVFGAIEHALTVTDVSAPGGRDRPAFEVVYLFSAAPAERGKLVDPAPLLDEVLRINELKRIRIHTIGVGKDQDALFLKELAARTRGSYAALP